MKLYFFKSDIFTNSNPINLFLYNYYFIFNFSCSKCDFNTKSEAEYVCHLKENHEVLPQDDIITGVKKIPQNQVRLDRLYKCKHCNFHVSGTKEQFWLHAEKHMNPEKVKRCPKCPFVTEFKHHLSYHIRNHLGQKPFKCPFCVYTCVNKAMLSSHLKYSHDGKKLVEGHIIKVASQEEGKSGNEITKKLRLFRKKRAKIPKSRIRTTSKFNGGELSDKTPKRSIVLEPRVSGNLDSDSVENISEKSKIVTYCETAIDNVITKAVPIEKNTSILNPDNAKAKVFKETEENTIEEMVEETDENSEAQITVDKFCQNQPEKPVTHCETEPDKELFEVTDDSVTQISVDKFYGNQPEKTRTAGPEIPKTCEINYPKPVPQGNFKCSLCKDTFKSVQEKLTHLDLAHRSHKCTDCKETFNSKQECTLHIKSNHEILPQDDISAGVKRIPKKQVRVWKCKHCKLQVARAQEHFGFQAEKNMNQKVKRCPKCPLSMMRLELIEEAEDIEPLIENNAENSKDKPTNSLQLSNNQEETYEEIHDKPLIEIEVTSEQASLSNTEKTDETSSNPFTISSDISNEKSSRNSAEADLIDEMPEKLPKTLKEKNLNEQHKQGDVEILSVNGVNDTGYQWQCVHCIKRFDRKQDLEYHQLVHREMPLACKYCKKKFTRMHNVPKHEKICKFANIELPIEAISDQDSATGNIDTEENQIDSDSEAQSRKESQISVEIPVDYEKVLSNLKSEDTDHPDETLFHLRGPKIQTEQLTKELYKSAMGCVVQQAETLQSIVEGGIDDQTQLKRSPEKPIYNIEVISDAEKERKNSKSPTRKEGSPEKSSAKSLEVIEKSDIEKDSDVHQSPSRKRGRPKKSSQDLTEKIDIGDEILEKLPLRDEGKPKESYEKSVEIAKESDIEKETDDDPSPSRKRGRPKKSSQDLIENIGDSDVGDKTIKEQLTLRKRSRPTESSPNPTRKIEKSVTDNETFDNQSPTRKRGRPRKSPQNPNEKLDGESEIEDDKVTISRRVYNYKCSRCNIAFKLKKDFEQHNILHGSVLHHDKSDGRSDIKDKNHEDQSPSRKRGRPKKNPEKFCDNEDQNHEDQSPTPRKRLHPKTYQFKINEIKQKELVIDMDMVNNKSDRKSDIGDQCNGDQSPARRRGRYENKPEKSDEKKQKELDIDMVYDKSNRKSDIGEQSHEDQSPSRKRGRPKKNSEKTNGSTQKELNIDHDMVQKLEILAGKLNKAGHNSSPEKFDENCDKKSAEDNEEIYIPVSKTDESKSPKKGGHPKKNPDAIINILVNDEMLLDNDSEMIQNDHKVEKEATDDSESPRKRGRPKKNPEVNPTIIGKEESERTTRTTDQQCQKKSEQTVRFLVEDEMLLDE